jgi:hypothetical protein
VKKCHGVETNHGRQQRPGTAEKPQVNEDQYVTCFETLHVGTPAEETGADGQLRCQVLGHQEARHGTGSRFRVRWAVDGREHCKSFKARPLADGFLTDLKDAVRDRRPFNPRTGLPEAETTQGEMVTWY